MLNTPKIVQHRRQQNFFFRSRGNISHWELNEEMSQTIQPASSNPSCGARPQSNTPIKPLSVWSTPASCAVYGLLKILASSAYWLANLGTWTNDKTNWTRSRNPLLLDLTVFFGTRLRRYGRTKSEGCSSIQLVVDCFGITVLGISL